MSSVGGAAPGGLDPAVYSLKEMGETAIFSAAFGPAGPLVNQVQNIIVSQVLPMMPDGPEKQLLTCLIDPLGALLTALMPPANPEAQCAGYAGGGVQASQYGATAAGAEHDAVPVGTEVCESGLSADEELAPPPTPFTSNSSGSVKVGVSIEISTSAQAATAEAPSGSEIADQIAEQQAKMRDAQSELDALRTLNENFGTVEMASGFVRFTDGLISMNDLEAIRTGPFEQPLKDAANYYVNHPEKFFMLETSYNGKNDGLAGSVDMTARAEFLAAQVQDCLVAIDALKKSQAAAPPPPLPPAGDSGESTTTDTIGRSSGKKSAPKVAALQGKEKKEIAPRSAPTPIANSNIPKVKGLAQKEIEDAKAADAAAASADAAAASGSTPKTEGTSSKKPKSIDHKGEFFPGVAKAIDKAWDEIDAIQEQLTKTDDPKEIQRLNNKLTQANTRMQMLTQLMSQLMEMMQNMSKLYNDIAMNSIRHIG